MTAKLERLKIEKMTLDKKTVLKKTSDLPLNEELQNLLTPMKIC